MELNIHYESGTIKHISVAGEMETRKEIESLLKLIDDQNALEITITFLDANIIHADVVERLDLLQKSKKCKIYVLKRYLYAYLFSLGIKCKYIAKKSLQKNSSSNAEVLGEEELDKQEVVQFLENIYSQYGYDYTGYQLDSIMRRIKICMLRENICNFKEFQSAVLHSIEIFEELLLDFSINTTEFFRDPEVFSVIKSKILPYLNSYAHIKIWCVGCSNGKEAYSLAILLDELGLLDKTQIYATDINPYIIEEAKNGLFSMNDIDIDISNYKNAGGKGNLIDYCELKGSYMKIKKYLQKNILFFQHSLVANGILNEFQLILCRNVLIYFTPELQEKALENFYKSLDRSGFLVLGKSEGIFLNSGHHYFTKYHDKEKIYRLRA